MGYARAGESDGANGGALPRPEAAVAGEGPDGYRASLRLLFAPKTADRIVALGGSGSDASDSLERVARRAELRYTVERWLGLLRRGRGADPPNALLGPGAGLAARPAVALALHLGLGTSAERLADIFGVTPHEIGTDLVAARGRLEGSSGHCPEYGPRAGRYRDPSLEINERIALAKHSQQCERCRTALARFEALDGRLLDALDKQRAALPAGSLHISRPRRIVMSSAGLLTLAGLLILIVVAGMTFASQRIFADERDPVPLVTTTADPAPDGWLLLTTRDGGVEALNPATGQRSRVAPDIGSNAYASSMLSPDGTLLATATYPRGQPRGNLEVRRVDGAVVFEQDWSNDSQAPMPQPIAWLDDRTLLMIEQPQPSGIGSQDQYVQQMQRENRLVALDVDSGQTTVLFQGDVASATPSPDGSLIALVAVYDQRQPGGSLVLRPVGSTGLGPPIATVSQRLIGFRPVWAPDSSRVYFSALADEASTPVASPQTSTAPPSGPTSLVALERDGTLTSLVAAPDREVIYPIAQIANGEILYQSVAEGSAMQDWETWIVEQDGSQPRQITNPTFGGFVSTVSSPGARWNLLQAATAFYLPADPDQSGIEAAIVPLLATLEPDGSIQPLLSLPSAAYGAVIGWLPPDAITPPPAPADAERDEPTAPEPVPELHVKPRIDRASSVSDDGDYVVMNEQVLDAPMIWSRSDATARRLGDGVTDLSWFPGEDVLIGVMQQDKAAGLSASRITMYAAHTNVGAGMPAYDFQEFDPARIKDGQGGHYATPLVAPNGLATSFFVVDSRRDQVQLWLATIDQPPKQVASWPVETGTIGQPPLSAIWINPTTLIYSVPTAWQDGMPEAVELWRLARGADGSWSTQRLISERAQGSDWGIVMPELTFGPDGTALAYRLRHYTHGDTHSGAYDTIVVANAKNIERRIEIARGNPGDGLSWAPGGSWLAFGLRGRISIASPTGSRMNLVPLPTDSRAGYPIWIGPSRLWFSLTDANGTHVMQARVH